MGSVFSQLLDTFPVHQAVVKIEEAFGRTIGEASADNARTYIRKLDDSSALTQPLPAASSTPRPGRDRLWGWQHAGNPPHRITDVACRVREYGYQAFRVFDHIEWGMVDDASEFCPQVRLTTTAGIDIDLPLDASFLHSRYHLLEGYNGENTHWLWPLEAAMDCGLVVAFAYELVQQRGQTTVMPYELSRDPDSEAALNELSSGGAAIGWGERALRGDFMPTRSQRSAPSREVGSSAAGTGQAPRVLVVMSFAVNKERPDFEPGGVAGMGKVYPQLLIKASIPLREVRGAVRWRRPSQSTQAASGSGQEDHLGCGGDSELSITPLMVTDANANEWAVDTGPFWSDIFAYYDDDYQRICGRMHVVKKDGSANRGITGYGIRRSVVGGEQNNLTKTARQGEFDSIHQAPSLRVMADRYVSSEPSYSLLVREYQARQGNAPLIPGSRSSWKLDHVKMAPFCTHDCLHTHWRWGTGISGSKRFVYGWSASAPHATAGAPMVPRNQDVYISLPALTELVYEVVAGPVQHNQIPAFAWQVINHHGSGFVTGIEAPGLFATAQFAVGATVRVSDLGFFRGSTPYSPSSSSAAFYWHLRYEWDSTHGVRERVELTTAQRTAARNL